MLLVGNSLLDHFDINLGLTPFSNNDDMFGVFGRSRTPWWKKDNVCVKREVLEEDDAQPSNINIVTSGHTKFHMQVRNLFFWVSKLIFLSGKPVHRR